MKIKLTNINAECYRVTFNNSRIGDFVRAEDGYFVFFPEERGGFWNEWLLRELADELARINKPWDDIITKDMEFYAKQAREAELSQVDHAPDEIPGLPSDD